MGNEHLHLSSPSLAVELGIILSDQKQLEALKQRFARQLLTKFKTQNEPIDLRTEMSAVVDSFETDQRPQVKQELKQSRGDLLKWYITKIFSDNDQIPAVQAAKYADQLWRLVLEEIVKLEQTRGVVFEEMDESQISLWISQNYPVHPQADNQSLLSELARCMAPESISETTADDDVEMITPKKYAEFCAQFKQQLLPSVTPRPDLVHDPRMFYEDGSQRRLSFTPPEGMSYPDYLRAVLDEEGSFWTNQGDMSLYAINELSRLKDHQIGVSDDVITFSDLSLEDASLARDLQVLITLATLDPSRGLANSDNLLGLISGNQHEVLFSVLHSCPEELNPLVETFTKYMLQIYKNKLLNWEEKQYDSKEAKEFANQYGRLWTFAFTKFGAGLSQQLFADAQKFLENPENGCSTNFASAFVSGNLEWHEPKDPRVFKIIPLEIPWKTRAFCPDYYEGEIVWGLSRVDYERGHDLKFSSTLQEPHVFADFLDFIDRTSVANEPQRCINNAQTLMSLAANVQIPPEHFVSCQEVCASLLCRVPDGYTWTAGDGDIEFYYKRNKLFRNLYQHSGFHGQDYITISEDDSEYRRTMFTLHNHGLKNDLEAFLAKKERDKNIAQQLRESGDRKTQLMAQLTTLETDVEFVNWRAQVQKEFEAFMARCGSLPEHRLAQSFFVMDYWSEDKRSHRNGYNGLYDFVAFQAAAGENRMRPVSLDEMSELEHINDVPRFSPDIAPSQLVQLSLKTEKLIVPTTVQTLSYSIGERPRYGQRFIPTSLKNCKDVNLKPERRTEIIPHLKTWRNLITSLSDDSTFLHAVGVLEFIGDGDHTRSVSSVKKAQEACQQAVQVLDKLIVFLSNPAQSDSPPLPFPENLDQFGYLKEVSQTILDLLMLATIQREFHDSFQTGPAFLANEVYDPYLLNAHQCLEPPFSHHTFHPKGVVPVSIELPQGEIQFITGMTGSGKTSYLRTAYASHVHQLIPPPSGSVVRYPIDEWFVNRSGILLNPDTIPPGHSLFSAGAQRAADSQGLGELFADELFQGAPSEFSIALLVAYAIRAQQGGSTIMMCDHRGLDAFTLLELVGKGDVTSANYIDPETHQAHDGISGSYGLDTLRNKQLPEWFVNLCQEFLEASMVGIPAGKLEIDTAIELPPIEYQGFADDQTLKHIGFDSSLAGGGVLGFFTERAGAHASVLQTMYNTLEDAARKSVSLEKQVSYFENISLEVHRKVIGYLNRCGESTVTDTTTINSLLEPDFLASLKTKSSTTDRNALALVAYFQLLKQVQVVTEPPEPEVGKVLNLNEEYINHSNELARSLQRTLAEVQPDLEPLKEEFRRVAQKSSFDTWKGMLMNGSFRSPLDASLLTDSNKQIRDIEVTLASTEPSDNQLIALYHTFRELIEKNSETVGNILINHKNSLNYDIVLRMLSFVAAGSTSECQSLLTAQSSRPPLVESYNRVVSTQKAILEEHAFSAYFAFSSRSDNQDENVPFCIPEQGDVSQMVSPVQAFEAVNLAVESQLRTKGSHWVPRNLFFSEDGHPLTISDLGLNKPPEIIQSTGVQKGGKSGDLQTKALLDGLRLIVNRVPARKAVMGVAPKRIVATFSNAEGSAIDSSFQAVAEQLKRVVSQFGAETNMYLDEPGRHTATEETEAIVAALCKGAQISGTSLHLTNHEKGADTNLERLALSDQVRYLNLAYPITPDRDQQFHQPPTYGERGGAESFTISEEQGLDPRTVELARFFHRVMQEYEDHKRRVL